MSKEGFIILILCLNLLFGCTSKTTSYVPTNQTNDIYESLGILTPIKFGAKADGKTDDSDAFNSMFDYIIGKKRCYNIVIPPGIYLINKTVNIPVDIPCDLIKISGHGATLQTTKDITVLQKGINKNGDISNYRLVIDGLNIEGKGKGIGMLLKGVYTADITNIHFVNLKVGLKSQFSLNSLYQNLRFTLIKDRSFIGTHGDWKGSTNTNSAFNANLIQNCRVYGAKGQFSHFEIIAGDNNIMRNCISEGYSPKYNIFIDSDRSPVVNHFIKIENLWIESKSYGEGGAYFYFKNLQGIAKLTDVQSYPSVKKEYFIENPNSNPDTHIVIDSYRGSTHKINNANGSVYGTFYVFKNSQAVQRKQKIFDNPNNWKKGVVPIGLVLEKFTSQNSGKYEVSTYKSRKNND